MKGLNPLLPVFLLIMLTTLTTISGKEPIRLTVDHDQRKQGEFFTVTLTGSFSEPTLYFIGHSYRMFRQTETSWRALVPVENLTPPSSYTLLVCTESREQQIPVTVIANNRAIQQITLDSTTANIKATEIEKSRITAALHTESKKKLFSGLFLRPVHGETSSLFGLKRSYNSGPVTSYHHGLDIAAPQGTPVQSTAKGIVILIGTLEDGFQVNGNTVIIDHGQGLTSVYLHLSNITVHEGQLVEAGEVIGNVGHTGISTAPHLHWGIYLYGTSVDPELFEGQTI